MRRVLGKAYPMIFLWWRGSIVDIIVGMPGIRSGLSVAVELAVQMLPRLAASIPSSHRRLRFEHA
eukprot:2069892-Amphidinium_carterae.1